MGLLNTLKEYLYLGSNEKGEKIYGETIKQMPLSLFEWQARVKIGGEVKDLSGEALRDFIAGLARNGVSLTQLDRRLKQAGLGDNQYALRQRILREVEKIISNHL
jgi:hypothetical protein